MANSGFSVKVTCGEVQVYAAETIKKLSEFNTLPNKKKYNAIFIIVFQSKGTVFNCKGDIHLMEGVKSI